MIINILDLKNKNSFVMEDKISFKESEIKVLDLIKNINDCYGKAEIKVVYPYIMVKLNLKANLILYSSRTLKEVPYKIDESDDFTFLLEKNDDIEVDDSIEIVTGNQIDLDPYFYLLFASAIPMKVISEDDKDSYQGENWEVISEDEYYSRKSNKESPFSVLEGYFDDDKDSKKD